MCIFVSKSVNGVSLKAPFLSNYILHFRFFLGKISFKKILRSLLKELKHIFYLGIGLGSWTSFLFSWIFKELWLVWCSDTNEPHAQPYNFQTYLQFVPFEVIVFPFILFKTKRMEKFCITNKIKAASLPINIKQGKK